MCEKRELALEQLGEQVAVELGSILADIDAAGSMAEFLEIASAARTVRDHGDGLSVHLDGGAVLTIESGHAGGVEHLSWGEVTRCRVKELEVLP